MTETITETVGQRLRRLRLERGLSQRALSEPGVSYAFISRIEAGSRDPSVKALRKLAARLGVTADYLETGEDTIEVRLPVGLFDMEAERLGIEATVTALGPGGRVALEETLHGIAARHAGVAMLRAMLEA